MQAKKEWSEILKVLKEGKHHQEEQRSAKSFNKIYHLVVKQ